MNVKARHRLMRAVLLLSLVMHFALAVGQDTDPPVIILNAPANEEITTNHFMQLSTTVNDDTPPMSVWIYGGTDSDPQTLLLADTNVSDDATLTFDWNARRLNSETGTMGLWHLDNYGSSTVYDSSGNTNDGSFLGDASWTWDGRFGYAIEFDGSDCALSIPDDNSLDVGSTGALTVEAWIYPYSVGGGNYRTIVAKRYTTVNYQVSLNADDGNLLFYNGNISEIKISDVTVSANTWSYIAVTIDATSGDVIFYLDGVPGDTMTGAGFGVANDNPLCIGAKNDSLGQAFYGLMDEIRLTSRVLSASKIAANYELGTGNYYWKVVAEDSENNSATSATWTFTVSDLLPT